MLKFFSFLGTTQYKFCNYYLDETNETDGNGKTLKIDNCCYIQEALVRLLAAKGQFPDQIVIFTTAEAAKLNWEQNIGSKDQPGLRDALSNVVQKFGNAKVYDVPIPDGRNEQEIWQIFTAVLGEIEEGDDIIFDITHSFRFLPMLAFLVLNYARILKHCEVLAIYYGAVEVLGKAADLDKIPLHDRNAPVFNLLPFIELFDWARGIDRYLSTGDATAVTQLAKGNIARYISRCNSQAEIRKTPFFKKLANSMADFSLAVRTCRGPKVAEKATALKMAAEDVLQNAADDFLPPLAPLIERLVQRFQPFTANDYAANLEAVKWCLENELIQQGLTLLEEAMVTYLCEIFGLNKLDKEEREVMTACAHINCCNLPENEWKGIAAKKKEVIHRILSSEKVAKDFWNLLYNLGDTRNDINHAGWQPHSRSAGKFKEQLMTFLHQAQPLLGVSHGSCPPEPTVIQSTPRMFLLLSHDITPEQETEGRENLGVKEFIKLPASLQDLWSNIPPTLTKLSDHIQPILSWLRDNASPGDHALISGDFGAVYLVVKVCQENNIIPVYSTTQRQVKEIKDGDKILLERVFRHVQFRRFGE